MKYGNGSALTGELHGETLVIEKRLKGILKSSVYRHGDVAQMVERPLSMREVLGSMPSFSNFFFNPSCKTFVHFL